jgi:hypothetical protein
MRRLGRRSPPGVSRADLDAVRASNLFDAAWYALGPIMDCCIRLRSLARDFLCASVHPVGRTAGWGRARVRVLPKARRLASATVVQGSLGHRCGAAGGAGDLG